MVFENPSSGFCASGSGCTNVQNSIYSKFSLFGMEFKLTEFAVLAFVILIVVYYLVYKEKVHYRFFLACSGIGAALAISFICIQLFVLKQICSNCMIVDTLAIIIFIIALIEYPIARAKKI